MAPQLIAYRLRLEGELDDAQAHRLSRALPYARLAGPARTAADRTRSLAGIALARLALAALLGRPVDTAELYFPARGKPRLRNGAAVHFSIAHSGPWVLAVAAHGEVGVDLEWLPAAPALGAAAHRAATLAAWVRREAEAKCLGLGLLEFLRHAAPSLAGTSLEIPECVAWLASRAPVAGVDVRVLQMSLLRELAAA